MFDKEVSSALKTAAEKYFLEINKNDIQFEKSWSKVFQSVTVKLLYITNMEPPDL